MTHVEDVTLAAIEARHWCVVLLRPLAKKPEGKRWEITRDLARVRRHLHRGGNIGLVCGEASGVVAVDDDKRLAFQGLEAAHGLLGPAWVQSPSTRQSQHYYLPWQPGYRASLMHDGEKIGEIQRGGSLVHARGQQVVIPPSRHPENGAVYRWLVDPVTTPLMPPPASWRGLLFEAPRPVRATPALPGAPSADLRSAAMAQPGARARAAGRVKFACPACLSVGSDRELDNAIAFADGGWGCAAVKNTPWSRAHYVAIGIALGALGSDGRRRRPSCP